LIGDVGSGLIEYFDNNTFNTILPNFHTNGIWHLKNLPFRDGYVASASKDNTVNIWDTLTWTSIQRYTDHTGSVISLDQIDNDTMVSGSWDGTVRIWKISTGETLKIMNFNSWVFVVRVFSIEKTHIVIGNGGSSSNLEIYNYTTGNLARTLIGHSAGVFSIEMLGEQLMASGGQDHQVIIWNITSYSIRYNLTGHNTSVNCIKRLSSNLIASGDYNGIIIVWNWLTGEKVFKLTGHTNRLEFYSLDLYDEQTLISGSIDKTVKLWNITNGTLIRSIDVDFGINTLVMLKSSE